MLAPQGAAFAAWPTPKAGSGPPVLGGRRGFLKWQPSHAFDASGAALAWPWRGPGVALACYVGRWCGARSRPQPLQNPSGSMVFSMPPKGSAFALRGTHARAAGGCARSVAYTKSRFWPSSARGQEGIPKVATVSRF